MGHIDGRYVVYGNEAYVPLREGLDPARYQYEGEDILGAMPGDWRKERGTAGRFPLVTLEACGDFSK